MTVKEYSKALSRTINQKRAIDERIKELTEKLQSISGQDYSKDKVQTSPQNALENGLCEITELEERRDALQKEINEARDELQAKIDRLNNQKQRQVLKAYYINFHSVQRMAAITGTSYQAVKQLLKRGEIAFNRAYDS